MIIMRNLETRTPIDKVGLEIVYDIARAVESCVVCDSTSYYNRMAGHVFRERIESGYVAVAKASSTRRNAWCLEAS